MKIEDRLYSESSGEVLYSVSMSGPEYQAYREFKRPLSEVKSNRGLGRSAILGALGGNALGGMAGGYVGKIAANDADRAGLSDEQIVKKASRAGAVTGAASGVVPYLIRGRVGKNPIGLLAATSMGAAGGYFGAKKNTKSRLRKRDKGR